MSGADQRRIRWQLILGEGAEEAFEKPLCGDEARQDQALGFLYGREYGAGRNVRRGNVLSPPCQSDATNSTPTDDQTPQRSGSQSGSVDGPAGAQTLADQSGSASSGSGPAHARIQSPAASANQGVVQKGDGSSPQSGTSNPGDSGSVNRAPNSEGRSQAGADAGGQQSGQSGDTGPECVDSQDTGETVGLDAGGQPGSSSDASALLNGTGQPGWAAGGTSEARSEYATREGGMSDSRLTVLDWINAVHELFPRQTIERLERDALERYQLEELVTNLDLLKRAQPSQVLLKAVLRTKHLMNQEVLALARQLVRKVVDQLIERLARPVRSPFLGAIKRQRSQIKIAKNFDPHTTIRRNLRNYNRETHKLSIETPYFFSRVRRQVDRWQLIILVDESGSMLDSVIYSAVTAAIFFNLHTVRMHLCIFDTNVVDLTEQCTDPVETLMKIQLGGGTDIGQALAYASTLVEYPRRTIVVLITDFYEGAPIERLYSNARALVESGVTLLGLAALDEQANPAYDRTTAQQLVNLGAQIGAMTPGELATWIALKVR
jgi:VWA domain containing CoxE-like protein